VAEKVKRDRDFEPRDRNFVGALLLGIGLLALLVNIASFDVFGLLVLPAIGLFFLVWAFYTRRVGLVIPGCILTGLGIGLLLSQRLVGLAGEYTGAVIVLGLAGGFAGIALIAPFFGERALWSLIPGGIIGLVGVLLLIGGDALRWLELLGTLWPLILVAIGLYILFWPRYRHHSS
jgi:hypothetical protein